MSKSRHVKSFQQCIHGLSRRNQALNLRRSRAFFEASRDRCLSTNAIHACYNRDSELSSRNLVLTQSQRLYATPSLESLSNNVPLTVIDVQLRHEQLPFAYFFEETLDIELLTSSLREVLQWYPVLGGSINLTAGRIECNPEKDTIRLSFAKTSKSLEYWLQDGKGHKYTGGGGHPQLLPLFDPLFPPSQGQSEGESMTSMIHDLTRIRVTHCKSGGTILGVNMNHALGDASSCIRFVQCWGREMRKKQYPRGASNDRSSATCSGMLTEELAELMGLNAQSGSTPTSMFGPFDAVRRELATYVQTKWYDVAAGIFGPVIFVDPIPMEEKPKLAKEEIGGSMCLPADHEYVLLSFSKEALVAMKAYGMEVCNDSDSDKDEASFSSFVSTNDMMTACGWLMKRKLSGNAEWNTSIVVNLRGRCGVDDFTDMNSVGGHTNGVFGNGITNVIASLPPSTRTANEEMNSSIPLREVAAGAMAIRNALTVELREVPNRIARSRIGKPQPAKVAASGPSFSTTSWGQFPLWEISFSSNSMLNGFHGHPSHPLPLGRTYASVIAPRQDGGYQYKLLIPTDKAEQAKLIHKQLCSLFITWHGESKTANV